MRVTITETREYTFECESPDAITACQVCRDKLPDLTPEAQVTERFYLYGDGPTADTGDECLTDADLDHVPSTTRDLNQPANLSAVQPVIA